MNKKLLLQLVILLQGAVGYSCNCGLQSWYFCESFGWEWYEPDEELVLIRVLERGNLEENAWSLGDTPYLKAEVVESVYAESLPDTISLLLDDGANCAGPGYYSYGDTVLVQIQGAYPVDGLINPYFLDGCGVSSLAYQNDTLIGNITFATDMMSLNDFVASVEICKNTVPHLYLNGRIRSVTTRETLPGFTFKLNAGNIMADSLGEYSEGRVPFLNPEKVDTLVLRKEGESFADITLADVIRIRRHILDQNKFRKIWEFLAADINGSRSITTLDVILLQRVILGLDDHLPVENSWIIAPATNFSPEYNFYEDEDWDYPLQHFFVYPEIESARMELDLWVIKIGDLV